MMWCDVECNVTRQETNKPARKESIFRSHHVTLHPTNFPRSGTVLAHNVWHGPFHSMASEGTNSYVRMYCRNWLVQNLRTGSTSDFFRFGYLWISSPSIESLETNCLHKDFVPQKFGTNQQTDTDRYQIPDTSERRTVKSTQEIRLTPVIQVYPIQGTTLHYTRS